MRVSISHAFNGASLVGMIRRAIIGARPASVSRDGSVMQRGGLTTSWRRRSDRSANSPDSHLSPRARVESAAEEDARQIEAWANEGGNAAPFAEPAAVAENAR